MPPKNPISLSDKLRKRSSLKSAWQHIYDNGKHSKSAGTRKDVAVFKENEDRNLKRIYDRLLKNQYIFKPAKGVLWGKGKKKKRPLVITEIEDRVVQRALLEVLQEISEIKTFLRIRTSFGAIEGRGVPDAVEAYHEALENGCSYFYKSDIKEFFTKISLSKVIGIIDSIVDDPVFIDLIDRATHTEIHNLASLGTYKKYFEYNEVGTPQGCCLSPLLGNILLNYFDNEMNLGDIVCLRYLDDFLILGPSQKAVNKAFGRATKILGVDGLTAYNATDKSGKSMTGHVNDGFQYLGLDIRDKVIKPTRESRKEFLTSIKGMVEESVRTDFTKVLDSSMEEFSFLSTLTKVNNKLKGWGNQYFFCNEEALWGSMDKEVSNILDAYIKAFSNRKDRLKKLKHKAWLAERRILGVHLFHDSKKRLKYFKLKEVSSK